MSYEYIFFDFDGTLVNTMDSFEILSTVNPTFFAKNTNEIYKIICQEK